jgi:glyoxylase-like metal-dependent hydrolase (beta-lactamase superfamily II)
MRRARENLAPYDAAGRLIRFDGAGTPISGVAAIPAYGHTPGHTAFLVESRGSRLLVWGDVVHLQQLQFPNPNVSLVFDVDADAARETRKAMLAQAAAEGYAVAGMHMAWPGIGHVRKAATGYVWEPIP